MYETNEKTKLSNQHHETNQNTKLSNHCLVSSSIDERIHDDFVDESQLPSQFVDSFKKHISTPKTALKNPFILESPLEGEFVVLDDCGDSDGSVLIRKSSDIQSSDLCNLNTESQEMSIDLNENIADESFLFQQNDINLDGKSYNRSFTHRELANCMEDYVSQNISIDGTNDLRIIHKDNTYLDNHTINFNCQVKSITNDRLVGLTLTDLNERINDPDSIDSNDNHISNLNTSVRRAPTFSMKVDLNKWV